MFDYIKLVKEKIIKIFYSNFQNEINNFVENNSNEKLANLENSIIIEVPKNKEFGDLSSNLCLIFSSILNLKPKEIAEKIKDLLEKESFFNQEFKEISIAGSGFINFKFNEIALLKIIEKILKTKNYGSSDIGSKKKVNLEFCSSNPTGPVHLGHIRGAVWGMVVGNILKFCGFDVHKEFYINDGGGQIETLVKSVFLRYLEVNGFQILIPDGFYPGEYLKKIASDLFNEFQDQFLLKNYFDSLSRNQTSDLLGQIEQIFSSEPVIFQKIRDFTLEEILGMIRGDLKFFDVEFDIFSSETEIISNDNFALLNETLSIFENQNLLYYGKLEKPKSADEEWEEKEQLLFSSTKFGDDMDRAMKRSSGEWTYFAKDCAYHLHKLKRGYERLILEVGVDHIGYKKRLSAAVSALSRGINHESEFNFEFHNMVYIKKNDEQLKMSKRSGNLIGADFLRENLGSDVTKFYLLSKKHDMELEFDIDKASEASKDNPYFYIQYGSTRAYSILRNFEKQYPDLSLKLNQIIVSEKSCFDLLGHPEFEITPHEKAIIIHIINFPRIISQIAIKLEPHRLNFYLSELASLIHSWWNEGISDQSARIILGVKNEYDEKKVLFRTLLVKSFLKIIESGLGLMNIESLKSM